MVGYLKGYGSLWFYANGVSNTLYLHRVTERFNVTYDSKGSNFFIVWNHDRQERRFVSGSRGLYYCNLRHINGTISILLIR